MNNKGFTLIELIGIIIIVSVIMILSFSSLTNTLKKTKLKEIEDYKLKVATAAQIYVETDLMRYEPFNSGTHIDITIEELINRGYLKDDIEVPGKCTFANTTIVATKNEDNTISYEVSCGDEATQISYDNGTAIYFDPVAGSKCTAGEAVSTTGTKTGCMKWYTFNDGGALSKTINLILDHNTTAVVAWNSTGSNVSGPTNVMTQLASDTNSWTGVPTRTDNYTVSNGTATYTINYNTYKARLITAAEIATITGNSSFVEATTPYTSWFYFDSNNQTQTATTTGASNYNWLFDYTNGCTSYGCKIADASNYGYWTSTAVSGNTSYTWRVYRFGSFYNDNAGNSSDYGLRPVITISKNLLQ